MSKAQYIFWGCLVIFLYECSSQLQLDNQNVAKDFKRLMKMLTGMENSPNILVVMADDIGDQRMMEDVPQTYPMFRLGRCVLEQSLRDFCH